MQEPALKPGLASGSWPADKISTLAIFFFVVDIHVFLFASPSLPCPQGH